MLTVVDVTERVVKPVNGVSRCSGPLRIRRFRISFEWLQHDRSWLDITQSSTVLERRQQ